MKIAFKDVVQGDWILFFDEAYLYCQALRYNKVENRSSWVTVIPHPKYKHINACLERELILITKQKEDLPPLWRLIIQ